VAAQLDLDPEPARRLLGCGAAALVLSDQDEAWGLEPSGANSGSTPFGVTTIFRSGIS
jgi:hypothetical protein